MTKSTGARIPWSAAGAGAKLLITKSTIPENKMYGNILELTVDGQHFVSANGSYDKYGALDTWREILNVPQDSNCAYSAHVDDGKDNGVLESGVLTINLTGAVSAFCSTISDWTGTLTEQLQATKDK